MAEVRDKGVTAAASSARLLRFGIATAVAILVLSYLGCIVTGNLPNERKIDSTALTILVISLLIITILVSPQIFSRIRLLELAGFKLQLDEILRQQSNQSRQLEVFGLVLPILLPEPERDHLLNLQHGKVSAYEGSHAVRTEIRRLCSFGLLRRKSGRHVSELKDHINFDLSELVELTALGQEWVQKIEQLNAAAAAA